MTKVFFIDRRGRVRGRVRAGERLAPTNTIAKPPQYLVNQPRARTSSTQSSGFHKRVSFRPIAPALRGAPGTDCQGFPSIRRDARERAGVRGAPVGARRRDDGAGALDGHRLGFSRGSPRGERAVEPGREEARLAVAVPQERGRGGLPRSVHAHD